MKTKCGRVWGWGLLATLAALGVGLVWLTRREMRQEALDVALIAAAKKRNQPAVLHLLEEGANPNARDVPAPKHTMWQLVYQHFFRRSVVDKAVQNAPTPLTLLFDHDPYWHNKGEKPGDECPVIVAALLDKGADPNVKNKVGDPILAANAGFGYAATVRLLLQHGADVSVRTANDTTPLIYALDNVAVMEALLVGGADVNQQDAEGNTALIHAIQDFYPERIPAILKVLLHAHADANIANHNGTTPLMWSAQEGDVGAVRRLLAAGARVNYQNDNGWTALNRVRERIKDYAPLDKESAKRYSQVVSLLKKAGAEEVKVRPLFIGSPLPMPGKGGAGW